MADQPNVNPAADAAGLTPEEEQAEALNVVDEPIPAEAVAGDEVESAEEVLPVEEEKDYKDLYLRGAADLDNVRKRARRDVAAAQERGVGKLVRTHRRPQRLHMLPFGMIEPGVEPLAPVLALGQMLEKQPARDGMSRPVAADADADEGGNLFGLDEIAFDRLRQRLAVERNDPLIAPAAGLEVEGDRQIALAEQREERRLLGGPRQLVGVILDVAAQRAAAVVAHEKLDDAVLGAGLHRQLASGVLQRRADQRDQRQRLGEQRLDRGRIGVRGEDCVERGAEADKPPAGAARGDGEP